MRRLAFLLLLGTFVGTVVSVSADEVVDANIRGYTCYYKNLRGQLFDGTQYGHSVYTQDRASAIALRKCQAVSAVCTFVACDPIFSHHAPLDESEY